MHDVRLGAAEGRVSCGSWVSLGDTLSAEMMGRAGFDWLILDGQHGGVNEGNMLQLLQAVELGGTPGLVRVKWNDPAEIMRALDLGAAGVVVPMVSTAEAAQTAAQAVRYPPLGIRSYGRVRNSYQAAAANAPEPLCLVMIETREALDNLDAIAGTAGVDGLFIGPIDLAISMGFGPSLEPPIEVMEALEAIAAACVRHGVICGAATLGPDNAQAMRARGVTFLTLGSDVGFLRRGAAAEVARAGEWR
ncbi:MAG TPA: aldolase/citrate lyase family protein [Novosphingobium sp.]